MHQYTIIKNEDGSNNVLLLGHGEPLVAHSSHANYKAIVDALHNDEDADFARLFDVGKAINDRFQALSERVAVQGNHLTLDGDKIDDAYVEPIMRFLEEDIEDWKPLVAFLENVAANPSDNSKAQLSAWVQNQEGITLTAEGNLVGYKGVQRSGDGSLRSISSGTATVQRPGQDPEVITGTIPNEVGSVVTMPRSEVVDDPNAHCHRGLHVGTQRYATSWARGAMLEVHVNPRDVVSVPNDANGEKIRVCRYTVVKVLEDGFKYTTPLRPDDAEETLEEDAPEVYTDVDEVEIEVGARVMDEEGDLAVVIESDSDTGLGLKYDNPSFAQDLRLDSQSEITDFGIEVLTEAPAKTTPLTPAASDRRGSTGDRRNHGKGGATSVATKGSGRNPAQDQKGRFSAGRPGSQRDRSGRFTG
jgi:hypothetical protein